MSKSIYVYFSNKEYLKDFSQHPDFVPPRDYSSLERHDMTQEEYGKIKLKNGINLRLLLDCGKENKCPWCDHPEPKVIIEKSENQFFETIRLLERMYAKCTYCGAQGPTLNFNAQLVEDNAIMDEYKNMVLQRWSTRTPKRVKSKVN